VASGFVRYDNRDVGLSNEFDVAPPIDLTVVLKRVMAGQKIDPPYELSDMAADAVGLMDRLAIDLTSLALRWAA